MPVFARQAWTLIKKDLLVAALRRPISTTIRALLLPLAIILIISYSQYFFNPPQHYGIGKPGPILPLSQAVSRANGGRNKVVFVDNGMIGGSISSVIEKVSDTFHKAGKSAQILGDESELLDSCPSSERGTTSCFGAVVFHSSPNEPIKGGVWNYTIWSDRSLGHRFDVRSPNNDAQIFLLPLQNEIDSTIAAHMSNPNQDILRTMEQYPYTYESEEKREKDTRMSYLEGGIDYFGVVFFLGMVGIVYQMTGLIASEREHGLSQLMDAMVPSLGQWQPQAARLTSHYTAFAIIYFPSWLTIGIILSAVVYIKTSAAIMIFYHLTAGLALCSYSLVGAAFFKKAQLSGIITTVIAVVLAVIPQVLSAKKQTKATIIALSLIFPSSNYTYFLTFIGRWEREGFPANLSKSAPKSSNSMWTIHATVFWIFLIIQILVYPLLAAVIERFLFGTFSPNRQLHPQGDPSSPTVRLREFSKTYTQNCFLRIFWKKKADVNAVKSLTLDARKGQILMLLGPNGSGKSTTLDAIAGLSKVSSGRIDIDGNGGLGIAPQKNVLWDELTVEEHVRILYSLKAAGTRHKTQDIATLILACDLAHKTGAKSKTLSGGQKRKLQLAMMFAGGSSVCCVDEVSSGLDPLSRRKIWDILLAERGDRTIIMTTHFLDEADFLSDNIAILSKGVLKAEGSSVGLKHRFGDGYSIHVPVGASAPFLRGAERTESMEGTVYNGLDVASTSRVIDALETAGIEDYRLSGPTLEGLFLKLAGSPLQGDSSSESSPNSTLIHEKPKGEHDDTVSRDYSVPILTSGSHTSPWKQGRILYRKRWTILRRNYVPVLVATIIAIIGAGVSPIFLKYMKRMECSVQADNAYTPFFGAYTESLANQYALSFIGGPSAHVTDDTLAGLADIYSVNHTVYGSGQITNVQDLKGLISTADSFEDFEQQIADGNATVAPGGFWLGDGSSKPTVAWQALEFDFAGSLLVNNVANNLLTNMSIATSFSEFEVPPTPELYDFAALLFVVYFSLVFCLYPGFYALYPTLERIRNVRALQYSNGVRSLPLWFAYIMFDMASILLISVVSTILLAVGCKIWYHLPYLFLILFLYGISSTILGYIISMFARSQLAAWALCASGQVVMCLAYFGAYLGVQTSVPIGDLQATLDTVHFTIAFFSPIANVMRSLFVALNQFTILCGGASNPGAIELYGGPILYLIIQTILLFCILLWWDSGVSPLALFKKKNISLQEAEESSSDVLRDIADEIAHVKQSRSGLRVLHLSKSFRRNNAVDDVSFAVNKGEVFALLGPNGAGKSTAISLIRGDIEPSDRRGEIMVDETSVFKHRAAARAQLGVCPQFDASDVLTVMEQLHFYAQIRGVSDPAHNIEEVIRTFGLEAYRHRLVQKLSGGTKRKLSLAVALVGNPAVLLLDEPSSGLDAASKRVMWKTLSAVSRDRSIVLTTHSMEEADALAHRAGIMSKRMLTLGTVEGLRRRWGDVYHVHLVSSSAPYSGSGEMERLKGWIRQNLNGAELEDKTYGGQIRFSVPARRSGMAGGSGGKGIEQLFRLLEQYRQQLGIEYYSIGQTTMDEVFVKIVRMHGGEEENSGEQMAKRGWWSQRRG